MVYTKNIGETKLITKNYDIFVDDKFIDASTYSVSYANSTTPMELHNIQETALFNVSTNLGNGAHRVRVVSEFGVSTEDVFAVS